MSGPTSGVTYQYEDWPEPGTLREVRPGIHWLQMPLPFALERINLYMLEDESGWTIVDTGLANKETQGYWEQIFATSLKGKPVVRVIVTHLHPDHLGNAGWLCDRWSVPLTISRLEYYEARAFASSSPADGTDEAIKFYRQGGLPEDTIAEITQRGDGGYAAGLSPLPAGYKRIKDGDTFEVGGQIWRVISGAGHSPEHSCLYCEAQKVLISGDQVLPRITSNVSVHVDEPEESPLDEWLASHRKFLQLPPDTLVLPAHNRPFKGLHERLTYLIAHHEDRMSELEDVLQEPKTAADLLPVMFDRELDAFQTMLALGECIAHLHCLMGRLRVARSYGADGQYLYQTLQGPARPDGGHLPKDHAPMMV